MTDPPAPAAPGETVRPGGDAARAAAVAALVLAVFFAPAILTGGQFVYRDAGRMHHPVKSWVAHRLAAGRVPEWNPYCGLGEPLMGGAIDAVQHPFGLLLVVLPFEIGFKLWVLLSYLLAALGAYLWSRRLGLGWHSAVTAGLAFALCGYLVSASDNLTYLTTLAAIPLVLAAAPRAGEPIGPSRLAGCAAASALCAAGGDPQGWGFAVLASAVATVAAGAPPLGARLGRAAAVLGASLVGAAPFVLPVLAWIPYSSRGDPLLDEELRRWALAPLRLPELAIPHLFRPESTGGLVSQVHAVYSGEADTRLPWALSVYCGVTVLLLATLGAARSRSARLLAGGALLATWMAMGRNAGFGQIAAHLPVLSSFRYWEKLAVWPALLLAPAAGFGLEALWAGRGGRRLAVAALLLAAGVLSGWAGLALLPNATAALLALRGDLAAANELARHLREGLLHAGAFSAALGVAVLALAGARPGRWTPAVLSLLVVGDLAAANVRAYVLGPPQLDGQEVPLAAPLQGKGSLDRVLTPFPLYVERWPELREFESGFRWGDRTLMPSWNVARRIGNFDDYSGMIPVRTSRLFKRLERARFAEVVGLWGVGWAVVPRSLDLAAEASLRPPLDVVAEDRELPAFLVRIPHRRRAYLAAELASVDRRGAMEFVLRAGPADGRSVVEGPLPPGYRPPRGEVLFLHDEPEEVALRAVSDRPALLVLSDALAPGWTATVDGKPAEILPANYLVRGVWVGAGEHTVLFRYRTPGLRQGWAILAVGGLALAGWALARRRRAAIAATERKPG